VMRMPMFFSTMRARPDASNGPKNICVGIFRDSVFLSRVNPAGSAVVAEGAVASTITRAAATVAARVAMRKTPGRRVRAQPLLLADAHAVL
jgi:hypothetical protein